MDSSNIIAGVDEVGRGSLSGPVVAAAVILKPNIKITDIKDSKLIVYKKRQIICNYVKQNSIYAFGKASVKEIDQLNILEASLLAMKRAVEKLKIRPSLVLIDGNFAPKKFGIKYKTIIHGDKKVPCISAASILAKVRRDLIMIKLAKKYPNYGWDLNFGYGTRKHFLALKKYGITKLHRKTFRPIHNILLQKKY